MAHKSFTYNVQAIIENGLFTAPYSQQLILQIYCQKEKKKELQQKFLSEVLKLCFHKSRTAVKGVSDF